MEELNAIMREIMVRRLKRDVLKDLPSKRRTQMSIELRPKESRTIEAKFEELELLSRELNSVTEATQESRNKAFERQALVSELFRMTCAAKLGPVAEYVNGLIDANCPQTIFFAHRKYCVLVTAILSLTRLLSPQT